MDTVIFLSILATFGAMVQGAPRRVVLALWTVSLVAVLLLFKHHVTSGLDLNF